MDRDRDRDRDRDDRRYEDRGRPYAGGESYRPGQRDDTYRRNRSPRNRTPPGADTWAPSASRSSARVRSRSPGMYRRRSRSPAYRGRERRDESSYSARPRSPYRGRSPRRDDRPRSPLRSARRSRSPPGYDTRGLRVRSPLPLKRSRDPSPYDSRRPPSPHRYKRERLASPPRGRYDRPPSPDRRDVSRDLPPRRSYRSPSPVRQPRRDPVPESNWRRRSPSPPRASRSEYNSGYDSTNTSRVSSPPVHPDRLALGHPASAGRSPILPPSRQYDSRPALRSPPYRARSPRARERSPIRPELTDPISPARMDYELDYRRRDSPPSRDYEREEPRNGADWSVPTGPKSSIPSGPSNRNGNYLSSRPPTGPSRGYPEPPVAPSSARPSPVSAHNRQTSSMAMLSAPTRPRGGGFGRGGPPREPSFAPPRRGPSYSYQEPDYRRPDSGPPTGPRGGYPSQRDPYSAGPPPRSTHYNDFPARRPPFRTNNSTSTTYPHTQHFNNPAPTTAQTHLAALPSVIPGGKTYPSPLEPGQEQRLEKLEAEREKLLQLIEEKQREKRKGLREWESLQKDAARDALRSELDEQRLEKLSNEGGISGSAF